MSTTYVSDEIDKCLEKFGESLKPPDEFIDEGKRLAQNVFLKLQKYIPCEFSVAEPRFGGSIGKSTGVYESDLDLVVKVNNKLPPFDGEGGVLETMEDILINYQNELQIQPESIKGKSKKLPVGKPNVSIQFSFKNGMEVDLLPAANLEPNEVLSEIAKDPEKNYYMYHSSLVALQLAFMRSKDSFTHSLVRVAKALFKTLDFGDKKFFGGSTIMESIFCAAAEEEQKSSEERSMFRALERVLKMVSQIDSLKLAFMCSENWRKLLPSEINGKLVPRVIGTTDILNRKCFIVDPSNPYCDQLDSNKLLPVLKTFAVQFINKLEVATELPLNASVDGKFYINKLFEIKPTNLTRNFLQG